MKNKLLLISAILLCSASNVFSQTELIPVEDFETDKLGVLYQANFFSTTTSSSWYRRGDQNTTTTPGSKLHFDPVGITGQFIAADNTDEGSTGENPLGQGEYAYFTFKTLDVSDYDEIDVVLKLGASQSGQFSYENEQRGPDGFQIQVAFDDNIATGANIVDALPTVANLNTGTYISRAQFSPSADNSGNSLLGLDFDFDGRADQGSPILAEIAQEFQFTIPTEGATLVSVRLRIANDQDSEDIFFDDISISGDNTLTVNNDLLQKTVVVYPNPIKANRVVNLLNKTMSGIKTISVYNVIGKQVFNKTIHQKGEKTIVSLPETLKAGVYFLKIMNSKNNLITKRIILE